MEVQGLYNEFDEVINSGDRPLVWLGWTPSGYPLSECEGDCDSDAHCASGLKCYHDGVPPGCVGTAYHRIADYCYDPAASTNAAADGLANDHLSDDPTEEMEPDQEQSVDDDHRITPLMLGAAIAGAVVVAGIVALLVAMRKRNNAKSAVPMTATPTHAVPDLSVSEIPSPTSCPMVEVSQSTTVPETSNEAKEEMEAV